MELKDRIKYLRETLKISQEEFGEKIGVARNTIANYEIGNRTPKDVTLKSICREFNANYLWLTEGTGDMFTGVPETIIDELVVQYDLNDIETEILRNYLTLTKEQRQVVQEYLRKIFNLDKGK